MTVDRDQVSYAGTVRLEAEVSLADGIDLDHTLAHRAEVLKSLGSTESLDVRRSMALGVIARHHPGCEHTPEFKPRQLVINVHLHDQQVGRCETTRTRSRWSRSSPGAPIRTPRS